MHEEKIYNILCGLVIIAGLIGIICYFIFK
jgi:hypothetical protein